MHEHIQDVTRRFAREGFLGITFEPYAREGGVLHLPDIGAVRKVVDPVPDSRVMADLDAIVSYAKGHPSGRGDRIGVTGFCRGGMYTLLFAAHSPEVKAAVWRNAPIMVADITIGYMDANQAAQDAMDAAGATSPDLGPDYVAMRDQLLVDERERLLREARERGVEEPEALLDAYLANYERWTELTADIGNDREAFAQLLWDEIYSKLPEDL